MSSTKSVPKSGNLFSYSIGKKLLMSLTGLFLILFLTNHAVGNMLLYSGPEAFDAYSEFMSTFWLIRIVEILLFAGIILHVADALFLTRKNAAARPVKYKVNRPGKGSSWFSRNMGFSGTIVLIFLVLHLVSMFARHRLGLNIGFGLGEENFNESIYNTTVQLFSIWWYDLIYVAALVLLAFHLQHGFQSAFQTLGLNHKKYTPIINKLGLAYSIIIPAIFASMPIYFFIKSLSQA